MKITKTLWAAAAGLPILAMGCCGNPCGETASRIQPAPCAAPAWIAPVAAEKPVPEPAADVEAADKEAPGVVTRTDLQHRRFVLVSIDGEDADFGEIKPEIEFLEGFQVVGRICNRFRGPGELENGVLRAGPMAMTMMLCADEKLNRFEQMFGPMLDAGVKVTLANQELTLANDEHTLVYRAADWVH